MNTAPSNRSGSTPGGPDNPMQMANIDGRRLAFAHSGEGTPTVVLESGASHFPKLQPVRQIPGRSVGRHPQALASVLREERQRLVGAALSARQLASHFLMRGITDVT
jgi:hypothetical protein